MLFYIVHSDYPMTSMANYYDPYFTPNNSGAQGLRSRAVIRPRINGSQGSPLQGAATFLCNWSLGHSVPKLYIKSQVK